MSKETNNHSVKNGNLQKGIAKLLRIESFFRIAKFLGRDSLKWLVIGSVSSLTLGFVELIFAGAIQLLLVNLKLLSEDVPVFEFLPDFVTGSFLGLVALLLSVGLVRLIAQYYSSQSAILSGDIIISRLRVLAAYRQVMGRDGTHVPASEVGQQLAEIFPNASWFCRSVSAGGTALIQAILLFMSMLYYAWRESLVAAAGIAVIAMISLWFGKLGHREANLLPQRYSRLSQSIERIARNWLLVRAFGKQNEEFLACTKDIAAYSNGSKKMQALGNAQSVLPQFMGIGLIVLILSLSKNQWQTSGMQVVSMLYLLVRLTQVLAGMSGYFSLAVGAMPNFKLALRFFNSMSTVEVDAAFAGMSSVLKESNRKAACSEKATAEFSARKAPSIEFRNVSFSFPREAEAVITNQVLQIAPGEQVAFVGPSGCGKTTCLAMILGLMFPSDGEILIDGRLSQEFWEERNLRVGYAGPDPFIISGTIRDNLQYGSQIPLRDSECWEALEIAGLATVVKEKSNGLHYLINENADGLSAGQKQRLSFARAVVCKPELLILDEPTANLDRESEQQIIDYLHSIKATSTVVIVSHRPELVQYADKIFVYGEKHFTESSRLSHDVNAR